MKRKIIIFVTAIIIFATCYASFGATLLKSISVELNSLSVKVNGKILPKDNIIYKGKIYIRADKVSAALDKVFAWDRVKKTVSISDKPKTTPTPSSQANKKPFNFRNTYWRMSIEDVKKAEKTNLIYESDVALAYNNQKISGLDSELYYNFEYNKLYMGIYTIVEKHTNYNLFIDNYNELKQSLNSKYGKGKEEIIWNSDLYKDNAEYWGMAVSMGYLSYVCRWESNGTKIMLSLNGDNLEIYLRIAYIDSTYIVKDDTEGL